MLNLIWKLVCLAALISILCLMSTGRVVLNDIKDSTVEIKAKIESKIVDPIKKRSTSKDNDTGFDFKLLERTN
jgi:hypothetical protein